MKNQRAFTTVELLIATAVFSLVLVVAIFGFLQIGQIFYKGITATKTQESAQDIISSLSADIRFAGSLSQATDQSTGSGTSRYFCAGAHRYTFMPGNMVNKSSWSINENSQNFGIVRDDLAVAGSCGSPYGPSPVSFNNPEELLGDKMRAGILSVSRLSGASLDNMYTLQVKIAYGENSALQNPTASNVSCNSNLKNSQYCHVSDLRTSIRRGF